ncbi:transmembrane protein 186 [Galendromus occidentalis]|uniref:Transmembrane protein 186 n=1 Tax=Galendromus occidentalis TaxID=34638 RepID=A0AAJ6QTV3_9ACAR|nr:transmembrane protein 186 [Galendromus occidentalis]
MLIYRALAINLARRGTFGAPSIPNIQRHLISVSSVNLVRYDRTRGMCTEVQRKAEWSAKDVRDEVVETHKTGKGGETEEAEHPLDKETWTPIYRFRYIRQLRLATRLKMFQAACCVASVPALPYMGLGGNETMMILAIEFYILVMTVFVGQMAQKAVGVLYLNESREKLRVASLTFLGRRVDTMYDVQDIMHVADTGLKTQFPLVALVRYSDPKEKMLVYTGNGILDRELFEHVFGEVPTPAPRRLFKSRRKEDT